MINFEKINQRHTEEKDITKKETEKETGKIEKTESREPESVKNIESAKRSKETEQKYQELIQTPEAKDALENNSQEFYRMLEGFSEKIDTLSLEQIQSLSPKKAYNTRKEYIDKLKQAAGILAFGKERNRAFYHLGAKDEELTKDNQPSFIYEDAETQKKIVDSERENLSVESLSAIDSAMRNKKQAEASLFALGIKDEQIETFLETRAKLEAKFGKAALVDIPTMEDFSQVRFRAYHEARKTAHSLFIHKSSPAALEKILESKFLKSASLIGEEEIEWEYTTTQKEGEKDKSIYFFRDGIATEYGRERERGILKEKEQIPEDFVALIGLGADILNEGCSLNVAEPTIFGEQAKTPVGAQLAQFENQEGTQISTEPFYIVVDENKKENWQNKLLGFGYNENWAKEHLISIPKDLYREHMKAQEKFEEAANTLGTLSPEYQRLVFKSGPLPIDAWLFHLRKKLIAKSPNRDTVFATIDSRSSEKDWSESYEPFIYSTQSPNAKIHKWIKVGGRITKEKREPIK